MSIRPVVTLCVTAALSASGLDAQAATLRIRNEAQLPVTELVAGVAHLRNESLMPGKTVEVALPRPGTFRVSCTLGFRTGATVDVVVHRWCGGQVTVQAGTVTEYVVRPVTAADVLSRSVFEQGGDPAFGGAGVTPAIWHGRYRTEDGRERTRRLVMGRDGRWTMHDTSAVSPTGTIREVSWPAMSTRVSFTLDGQQTLVIDRPYRTFFMNDGTVRTLAFAGRSAQRPIVTFQFCGYAPTITANRNPGITC